MSKIQMQVTKEQMKALFEAFNHYYGNDWIDEEDYEIRELYKYLKRERDRIREEEQIKEWTTEGACCHYDPDGELPF